MSALQNILNFIRNDITRPTGDSFVRHRVVSRSVFSVANTALSAAATTQGWIPVQDYVELLFTIGFQNPTSGAIVSAVVQFMVLDPFSLTTPGSAPIGAPVAVVGPNVGGAAVQSTTIAQFTNFGAFIRPSVTTTGSPTLTGNLIIQMQGKS